MPRQKITLADLRLMDTDTITPAIAGQVLGCEPYAINVAIRQHPERVQFPWFMAGRNVKIPREGFIRWMEGRLGPEEKEESSHA